MDEETKPVYKYVEETGLPDWSKYQFITPTDGIEWTIIQGTVLVATMFYAELLGSADAEDWEDAEFVELFKEAQEGMLLSVQKAEDWWKERER